MPELKHYDAQIATAQDGRAYLPIPFDPEAVWGAVRHLGGSLNTRHFRGGREQFDGGWGVMLSPMWLRDSGLKSGDQVSVILTAEGPLRRDLSSDFAEALAAEPAAAAFWDSLAPFYRKAYVRWVEGARRRPQVCAERIAQVTGLLKQGVKALP
jgi:hypothetical protein